MTIYCCQCGHDVDARLTSGQEIYPHREDLHEVPLWRCDACGNFVGCHHKTADRTRPLGNIPTPAIKEIRKQIHAIIDPIWKQGRASRASVYAHMSKALGRAYHTGELRTEQEAMHMFKVAKELYKRGEA